MHLKRCWKQMDVKWIFHNNKEGSFNWYHKLANSSSFEHILLTAHAQLCSAPQPHGSSAPAVSAQKCPQVVGSVKWQIRDSTTNFFTLILLREQQLSTVIISAQGCRDKQGAANGRATTLFNHTLNSLGQKPQCIPNHFPPFWKKITALNSGGVICRDPRGSWRPGGGGCAKQVVIDQGCCCKLCITPTKQLSSSGPARSLHPTTRLPLDARLSSRVNPIIKTSLWYTSLEPKKKSVFKLDKNMHLYVMFILHEYEGGEEDSF